eukprot:3188699-Amphidinium_carterae.1
MSQLLRQQGSYFVGASFSALAAFSAARCLECNAARVSKNGVPLQITAPATRRAALYLKSRPPSNTPSFHMPIGILVNIC